MGRAGGARNRKNPAKRRARRRRARSRRFRFKSLLPAARTRRRWLRLLGRAPLGIQIAIVACATVTLWLAVNGLYQVVRKPSELFFPISGVLNKTPAETWKSYAPIFRRHSTAVMTPELLAALAQVEASGNPVARTYWRWAWTANPFEVYRPASSAVGMYQITDGTFAEARRYCIHDHRVVEDGPWNDWRSCWFNALYVRTIPSHAVEMTSAYLDRKVSEILARYRIEDATLAQRQDLAAVIHLCGAGAGAAYARRGFRFTPNQRCGDHSASGYLEKVNAMKRVFARLSAEDRS